jgi:hypothetical protein
MSRGYRRYLPYVFTEQVVAMLSSVLNSKRAVEINIEIMRAFVRLRQFVLSHKELAGKLDALERKFESHDANIRSLFEAIRQLMSPAQPKKRKIGFLVEEKVAAYGRRHADFLTSQVVISNFRLLHPTIGTSFYRLR